MALTQVNGGMLDSVAQQVGFRNRIINGAMGIWQRGTSWSSPTYATYTADRWFVGGNGTSSLSQSSDVPTGYQYSLSTTGTSNVAIGQRIESVNSKDLVGQSITISFWLKQSTGAGSAAIGISAYYPTASDNYASVTQIGSTQYVNSTSSWAQYSVTLTNMPSSVANGIEIFIFANTASSATFLVTGVQLEKGSTATSFDYRPYGTELALCQRYFWKFIRDTGYAYEDMIPLNSCDLTAVARGRIFYPVPMRTVPSMSYGAVGNFAILTAVGGRNCTSVSFGANGASTLNGYFEAASANIATGQGLFFRANGQTTDTLSFSSEL